MNTEVFEANGTAERDAVLVMLEQIPGTKPVTVGGDKAYWKSLESRNAMTARVLLIDDSRFLRSPCPEVHGN